MAPSTSAVVVLSSLASLVAGHGYLKSITVNNQNYLAWQVGQDDYVTPTPARYARKLANNGPVPDFTSNNITCGAGGNIPAEGVIDLKAGDTVTLNWDQWGSSHSGPVMTYLAHCTGDDCKTFKGDTGNVWVKIEQLEYNPSGNPPWASDLLREQGAKWSVTIPPTLAPGEYRLRHEILGLHVAGTRMGAQFYPSCTQIRVTQGGSTQLPAGIALPGAYDPDDKGILTELWRIDQGQITYKAPGRDVWSEAAPNANRPGP
ncbi:family 61 putative glycoside hydrolase [Chaetomidium leptoderma]|uniref:lytic cellulose monooxygenase (C4-dehydrogenating) n=1 Tax=Chaetomidium leptoderma TaxID=669021 RepID=A0AAN7A0R4_9PEZI|nr:family 61 putative glycoside hydrolase [Chaetomidium leptoderma]